MPLYRDIPLPDGTSVDIEAPEGASREDAARYALRQQNPPMRKYTFQMPDGSMRTVEVPGTASRDEAREYALTTFGQERPSDVGHSLARGVRDPVDAGAQLLERVLPEDVVQRVNEVNNWLAEQGLPLVRLDERGLQGQLDDAEVAYQASRDNPGGVDWGRMGGQVAGGALAGAAAAPVRAASAAGRVGQAVAGGAVGGALGEPVTDTDEFWKEKGEQAAVGAVAGGALGAAAAGAGALGRQVTRPNVQRMRDMGVTPTPGQTLGGAADVIEQQLTSAPGTGVAIDRARTRTLEQFNKGVINEALLPLGKQVQSEGRDAIAEANRFIDDAYDAARSAVDKIDLDDEAMARIAAFDAELDIDAAADNAKRVRGFIAKRLLPRAEDGELSPVNFKRIDSELGEKAAKTGDPELKSQYLELQNILRDTAGRQSPEYAEASARANAAFRNMVAITDAAGRRNDSEPFTSKQFMQSIKSKDRSARRRASAEGKAPMQDAALAAEDVLGKTVPNSGSIDRGALLGTGAAVLGGYYDPVLTLGTLVGGSALYTDPFQRALFELSQRAGVPMSRMGASGALGGAAGAATGGGF